jgi:hypothetical protein
LKYLSRGTLSVFNFIAGSDSSLASFLSAQPLYRDFTTVKPLGTTLSIEHAGKSTINNTLSRRGLSLDGNRVSSVQCEISINVRTSARHTVAAEQLFTAVTRWQDSLSVE